MYVVHYLDNRNAVLTQLSNQIPNINEQIKIKGRKGKIVKVQKVDERTVHVEVVFEQITKIQLTLDPKKKKR